MEEIISLKEGGLWSGYARLHLIDCGLCVMTPVAVGTR